MIDKVKPYIYNVTERPVMVVGEKIHIQRPDHWGYGYALLGNRTGDFVEEALDGMSNVILTNIVNTFYYGNFDRNKYVAEGLLELIELIEQYNPIKIITLGGIAKDYVAALKIIPEDCKVINFPHPSWINRFQAGNRSQYVQELKRHLWS